MRHNKPLAEGYARTSVRKRKGYRVEWAGLELKVAVEERESVKKLEISEWEKGEWMTLKQLNVALGDDPEATANWAQSCIEIGPSEYKLNVHS